MAALYFTGVATGVAVVLEILKRRDLTRQNKDLKAALKEARLENEKLRERM